MNKIILGALITSCWVNLACGMNNNELPEDLGFIQQGEKIVSNIETSQQTAENYLNQGNGVLVPIQIQAQYTSQYVMNDLNATTSQQQEMNENEVQNCGGIYEQDGMYYLDQGNGVLVPIQVQSQYTSQYVMNDLNATTSQQQEMNKNEGQNGRQNLQLPKDKDSGLPLKKRNQETIENVNTALNVLWTRPMATTLEIFPAKRSDTERRWANYRAETARYIVWALKGNKVLLNGDQQASFKLARHAVKDGVELKENQIFAYIAAREKKTKCMRTIKTIVWALKWLQNYEEKGYNLVNPKITPEDIKYFWDCDFDTERENNGARVPRGTRPLR